MLSYHFLQVTTTMSQPIILVFLLSLVVIHPFCVSAQQWCIASPRATDAGLQANIEWGCSTGGVDCGPIQMGGNCWNPDTVRSHASFVMNRYYKNQGEFKDACDFNGTGDIVFKDPSHDSCQM